jgi:hypothetical protein
MPEAIDHWVRGLADRFPGGKIAVCLEPSTGSLIYALLTYDHLVLYSINPRMLAKFREAPALAARRMISRMPSSYSNWSVHIRRN